MQIAPGIRRRWTSAMVVACACALAPAAIDAVQDKAAKKPVKPTITLRASPTMGFAPARFVLTAEITGGPDDFEDFYCATIEWDWGDDTKSENQQDCDPYEAGKSEFKRRFTADHTYNIAGEFRAEFKLKQKKKVVGLARTEIRVRCGAQDADGCR